MKQSCRRSKEGPREIVQNIYVHIDGSRDHGSSIERVVTKGEMG